MDMRRLVGENVRRLRLLRGLTQEEFAELSGFSQQYISDLERGRRNPTVVSLFELAQALGSSPINLIEPQDKLIHGASGALSEARVRDIPTEAESERKR